MSSYQPILYHSVLSFGCARIKRRMRGLGLELELRDVLLSGAHRQQLIELLGEVKIPCLVHADTVVCGADEIERYLKLRYGDG